MLLVRENVSMISVCLMPRFLC